MNTRKLLFNSWFTIVDELHHKSFYLMTAIAILFTFMLRGCFSGNYMVNGQTVDGLTVGWHASIVGFHIIAFGGLLIAILLSMRSFLRDRDNGIVVMILSKSVKRVEYLVGKIIGLWVLSYGLTLILHISVYLIMLFNTGGRFAWFIPASLVTSLNILSIIVIVLLLSMYLPDILAALTGIGIVCLSLVIDSIIMVSQNESVQSIVQQVETPKGIIQWVSLVWPKITALQYYATSLIKQSGFDAIGPVHPVVNITLYSIASILLLIMSFSKREIT